MKTKPLTRARRSGPLRGETATVTAVGAAGKKSSQTQPAQSGILLCIKPQANTQLKHLVLMRHPASKRKRSTQRFALLMSHLGSKKWRTGMFHWLTSQRVVLLVFYLFSCVNLSPVRLSEGNCQVSCVFFVHLSKQWILIEFLQQQACLLLAKCSQPLSKYTFLPVHFSYCKWSELREKSLG